MASLPYEGASDLSDENVLELERLASYEVARRSTPASLSYFAALAALGFLSTFSEDHPLFIYSALTMFLASFALRSFLLLRFRRVYDKYPALWLSLQFTAMIIASLAWGMVSMLAMHYYADTWVALVAGVITSGMVAGGMFSVSMRMLLYYVYLVCILTPTIAYGFVAGGTSPLAIGLMYLTLFAYCIVQGRNVNREYWESRINTFRLDQKTKQRLHDLTYNDTLTGLPNRELLMDRLHQGLREARRGNELLGVMVLGLDRFKKINDTLGHQAGDALLQEVARRIPQAVRDTDTVARLGGDTFAIVLPRPLHARHLARVSQKVLERLVMPFEIKDIELVINVSIGIAVFPTDHDDADGLLANAEAAMFRAKERGGQQYQYYESSMNAQAMEQLTLETRLRKALARDEFLLHFQPKVNLQNGGLTGFEALCRWAPRGGDLVSPAIFIPILEDTGLIVPVGEWVLRNACRQVRQWQDAGLPKTRIAVNLSARQFRDRHLVERVTRVLEETGLSPQWLELEITESMLMDHTEHTFKLLAELNAMGVHLSIDDFGTGYSSLAYLKRMPVSTLKIDRSFIKDITTNSNDAAVVQAVIAMARNLNLNVIAEGAETAEQVLFLHEQSCNEMQGYFFSPPVPSEEARTMLELGCCKKLIELIPETNARVTRIK